MKDVKIFVDQMINLAKEAFVDENSYYWDKQRAAEHDNYESCLQAQEDEAICNAQGIAYITAAVYAVTGGEYDHELYETYLEKAQAQAEEEIHLLELEEDEDDRIDEEANTEYWGSQHEGDEEAKAEAENEIALGMADYWRELGY